jgi:thiol-disulfide isomerase/thioredoxin
MRSNFQLSLLLCMITISTYAQEDPTPSLNIGDPAPPLWVREWIKGEPIQRFEKGKVYVVEFWATWCVPCKAAMPHLSALAGKYKDKVSILGIDIKEVKSTSLEKVRAFVDSMGYRMDYHVAAEENNFMEASWLDASGEQGIPKSYVVDAEGRLAWIGHPHGLDEVLLKIVNDTWDVKEALAKRNFDRYIEKLDDSLRYELMKYDGDPAKPEDLGKPDSVLLMINEIVRNEPKLKYASGIAYRTFSSLLKTNPDKAYQYGKELLLTSTFEDPTFEIIYGSIESLSDKLKLPAEIYQLGAEAYQSRIDTYPETADFPKLYFKMAEWYWRANDKLKAIAAQQKSIEALKSKNATEMAEFESKLQQYKNM